MRIRGCIIRRSAVFLMLLQSGWACYGGDAVARVSEHLITRAMLEDVVQQTLNTGYYHRSKLAPEKRLQIEREALDKLIRRQLNVLGGLDRELKLPLEQAEQNRQVIEERVGPDTYNKMLESVGMTREEHQLALAETLLAEQTYYRFITARAVISDQEVEKAWKSDTSRWLVPESIHLEHILLKVPPEASSEAWQGREEEARELADRIRKGESFAALAGKHSDDMYRIKGGDLGWAHRGRLIEPLESAVWSAKGDVLVGPIRSSDGIHLARVLDRRPQRQMPYAEVEPMLRQELEKIRLAEIEKSWYDGLEAQFPVEILDPRLRRQGERTVP
jgi:parvulin-like peptidyl-prolyl isomerase